MSILKRKATCLIRILNTVTIILACITLSWSVEANDDTPSFSKAHESYVGLYKAKDEFLIIGQIPEAEIVYFQRMKTGDMRFLRQDAGFRWTYSPTRNHTDTVSGTVEFAPDGPTVSAIKWTDKEGHITVADKVAVTRKPLTVSTNYGAHLEGELILPDGVAKPPILVLVPQSNRYNLYDVGMWALSRGIGIMAYDQRNAPSGVSIGPVAEGIYQEQQAEYAKDAIAIIDHLSHRNDINTAKIGIVGWSGGGFTAAFVAAQRPNLAAYVNIAGDASTGFEQASHLYISRLYREGFSDADITKARELIALHFGVASGTASWATYRNHIATYENAEWYQYLTARFSIPYTDPDRVQEIGQRQFEWTPNRVYGQIKEVPTLGLFFEWDHSSAPSTPINFLMALNHAGNGHFQSVDCS